MLKPQIIFSSIALVVAASQSAFAQTGYKIVSHIKIGGDSGWDYLIADAEARRLYVTHGTEMDVIDLDSERVLGKIAELKGIHGVALAPKLNKGFISDGRAGEVVVFSLDKIETVTKVKVGENPDAILYEPSTKRVFAFNGRSKNISALDAAKDEVVGTIDLNGKPEFAATDGKGTVYVNLEDKSEVVQLDAKSLEIKNRWPVAPGEAPSALSLDKKNHRLFIGCGDNDKMIVMDSTTGKVLADLPIGKGVDADCFEPSTMRAFSSQGDGTVTVIHEESPDKFVVEDTVKTAARARTMTIDTKTHKLYLPTGEFEPTPEKTADNPRPRPKMKPGTFEVVVLGN